MAFLLPRCLILHIPKTGSDWVRAACHAAVAGPIREVGQWHCDLRTARQLMATRPRSDRSIGTFVRHPIDWYRSAWCYWKETGRFPRDEDAPQVECDDFEEFVRNCLRVEPNGYISTLYERFTGLESDEIDFIGRQETLANDLVTILRMTGEEFDEAILRETAPRNVRGSRPGGLFPGYSEELTRDVLRHEQAAVCRFGY